MNRATDRSLSTKKLSLKHQVDLVREEIHQAEPEIICIQQDKDHTKKELNTIQKLRQEIDHITEDVVYLKLLDYHFGIFRQEKRWM